MLARMITNTTAAVNNTTNAFALNLVFICFRFSYLTKLVILEKGNIT